MVCDFCNRPNPSTCFPTEHEPWAACDDCADLVDAGEWDTLARKAVDHELRRGLPESFREEAHAEVKNLHVRFERARTGPAIPLCSGSLS